MAVPFLTPSRCVLLVGDEALYVYDVTFNAARLVDTVPWQAEDFEEIVTDMIRKECKGKPVLILNDMTDQHFKGGQRIPKVGSMDKANVLKRKLQVAFPNYPIRGALPIKQPRGQKDYVDPGMKGAGGRTVPGGGMFLFAAVPVSEPIVKTINAVKKSLASIAGFYLLPVEASDMVKALSEKIAGKGEKPSRWVVFIGQHMNGDLRQVIIRDGQLAMTRMTSVTDNDSDPHTWASEVYQELKATISYLSRFGYSPEDETDLIVISSQPCGEALESIIDMECNYSSYTAPEAARLLGMSLGAQDEPRYADPLHVAWSGRKTKFILPMQAAEVSKIHRPRQYVAVAMFLLLMGAGYLGWQLSNTAQAMLQAKSELENEIAKMEKAKAEYEVEVENMASLGYDIKLIQGSIKTFEEFEKQRISVLPLIDKVAQGLGNDLRIDKFNLKRVAERARVSQGSYYGQEATPENSVLDVSFTMTFPPTIDLKQAFNEVVNVERRLKSSLPNYTIKIDKQVGDPVYIEQATGKVGAETEQNLDDYIAAFSIRGPNE